VTPRQLLLSLPAIVLLLIIHTRVNASTTRKAGVERIFGKVIDSKTKKPVDYASVSILHSTKDSMIAGMLTEPNGDFSFDNVPFGSYRIKVSFLGYDNFIKPFVLTGSSTDFDLGNIAMESGAKKLGEVTVTGEKAAVTMTVDRKVFNVDKDLSSRGGTGLDVMKNIPGVSIDADGAISLLNNTPLVYIDGKPSSLTLDQVPSDEIDRVEVITNPSAKFEAAASGGIINVILKQNRKPGYSGIVSALIGTNTQWNGTAMGYLHRGKLGFTLSFNTNGATNGSKGYTNRENIDAHKAPTGYYNQDNFKVNKRAFETIRASIDYYISNRNILTLTENIVVGKFSNDIDASIRTLDAAAAEISHGQNYNYEGVKRRTFTTTLDFKHNYPKGGKEYTISLNYERFRSATDFYDTANTYSPSGSLLPGSAGFFKQSIPSGIQSHMVTAQWDFVHPVRDSVRLEYGLRSFYKRTESFANVMDYIDSLLAYQPNAQLSSRYRTDELVNAAYVTVGQQVRSFSYQVGVRFEQAYFAGALLNKNQNFSYSYPQSPSRVYESFFPSFYLSERINEHHQLQLNVTRKTNRPNGGRINPNLEVIDQQNYTVGNPGLLPEFINQGELNYSLTIPKFDWLTSAYVRYTEHPITNFNFDSVINGRNAIIATYLNGKGRLAYGWENTFKINPTKNLNINLSGNVFYTSIQTYPDPITGIVVSNSGFSWTAKAMVNYKFPLGFAAQINGSYETPNILPQGKTTPLYFFDISVSKEIGIATINLTLSDVLDSKTHGSQYITPEFIQSVSRRREVRYAKIGVTFKFGKEEKPRNSRRSKKESKDEEE
jgi:iron complex outermembrane receptor protein